MYFCKQVVMVFLEIGFPKIELKILPKPLKVCKVYYRSVLSLAGHQQGSLLKIPFVTVIFNYFTHWSETLKNFF